MMLHRRATDWRVWCMLMLTILYAGCTDRTERAENTGNSSGDPEPPTELLQGGGWLNSTFTNLQSPGVTFGVEGDNCVFFSGPDFDITVARILNGFVEATWISPNPTLQEMALFVRGDARDAPTRGPSPLRLELHNITAHPQTGILAYLKGDPEPSVDFKVDMTLQWSFSYQGKPGPVVGHGACG